MERILPWLLMLSAVAALWLIASMPEHCYVSITVGRAPLSGC